MTAHKVGDLIYHHTAGFGLILSIDVTKGTCVTWWSGANGNGEFEVASTISYLYTWVAMAKDMAKG